MSACLQVLRAGAHTSVQDLGRPGYQDQGVPVSGVLDPPALRLANALAGNAGDCAGLEILLAGPVLEVAAESVRIAVAGTGTRATRQLADGSTTALAPWRSHTLYRGERILVGALADSRCACLAVAGGFAIEPVLGSRSTYARAGLGGHAGRPLAAGDTLPLALASAPAGGDLACERIPALAEAERVRVVMGPQQDFFTAAAQAGFLEARYRVGRDTDRMGIRLEGPALARAAGQELLSEGIAPGSIQVPHSGQPVILLADRQTTGGYPKIATVISADLPRVGRLRPGAALRFQAVDVAAAEQARRAEERELEAALARLVPAGSAAGVDVDSLYSENLVSGVTDGEEPEPR